MDFSRSPVMAMAASTTTPTLETIERKLNSGTRMAGTWLGGSQPRMVAMNSPAMTAKRRPEVMISMRLLPKVLRRNRFGRNQGRATDLMPPVTPHQ